MKQRSAWLVERRSDDRISGGYRYNTALACELERRSLGGLARIGDLDELPGLADRQLIIDSLLLGSPCPAKLAQRLADHGTRLLVLGHYFPPHSPQMGPGAKAHWLDCARVWMRLADAVIVTGYSSLPGWQAQFPGHRFHVVPPAVTTPKRGTAPRNALPRILTLGRVTADKLPLALLRALASLARQQHFEWRIVGPRGAEPSHVHAIARVLEEARLTDRVHLPGAVSPSTVTALLERTDLYLATSQFESFGMASAEALAAGVPLLGFDVGDVGRWLPGDPACQLVPVGRFEALIERLRDWLAIPTEQQPQPGKPKLPQPSWRSVADQVLTVYRHGRPA